MLDLPDGADVHLVSLHRDRSARLREIAEGRAGLTMQDIAQACWEAIDDAYPDERAILVGCSIGSSMLIWMHNHRLQRTAALIMCGTGYNPNKEFIPPRIEAYKEQGIAYRWGYTFEDFSPAFRSTPMAHFFAELFADRNEFGDVDTIITQFQAYRQPEPEGHHARVACPAIILTGSEDNTHDPPSRCRSASPAAS